MPVLVFLLLTDAKLWGSWGGGGGVVYPGCYDTLPFCSLSSLDRFVFWCPMNIGFALCLTGKVVWENALLCVT